MLDLVFPALRRLTVSPSSLNIYSTLKSRCPLKPPNSGLFFTSFSFLTLGRFCSVSSSDWPIGHVNRLECWRECDEVFVMLMFSLQRGGDEEGWNRSAQDQQWHGEPRIHQSQVQSRFWISAGWISHHGRIAYSHVTFLSMMVCFLLRMSIYLWWRGSSFTTETSVSVWPAPTPTHPWPPLFFNPLRYNSSLHLLGSLHTLVPLITNSSDHVPFA